jgi:PAS domain S-box-containing protein
MTTGAAATTWRVVIIADSERDRAEVRRHLVTGSDRRYELTEAATGAAGVRAVLDSATPYDCVVLDHRLPDMDAVEVLTALAGPDALPVCPVVVLLTDTVGSEHTRAVLRAGAQDYLGRAWMTPESLTRALDSAVERWAMTRELQDRNERLRLAVEASATGLWTWDVRTDSVTWSPECYRIHGVSPEAFDGTGTGFFRLVHPDDRARTEATVRAAIDSRALYESEFRVVRPDGEVAWVANRGRCSYDADGRPVRVLGTISDISNRKGAEDQLRRSHDTFAQLIQNIPFGVFIVDADFRLRQASVGTERVFGPIGPLLGRGFDEVLRDIWPEPFAVEVEAHFRRTLATGEPYISSSTVERRAHVGEVEAYDWRIEQIALPDGRPGVVCYYYDLSDRLRWETALRERERELQSIANNTPDILTRFDRDLRHVFVNTAVERATGRPRQDFLGKTNRELGMPVELCDRWDAAFRRVFESGQPTSLEFTFDAPSGARHYSARLVPEIGDGGTVEFVLGVTHDVTDARATEAAMRAGDERLRLALAAARAGAWAWEVQTGAITWSSENYALYGRDPAAGPPTYADWEARLHPDDRARVNAATADTLAGHTTEFRAEYRVAHETAGERWLLGLGRVELGADGAPVRMVGINLDITDRKRFEQTLAEQDRRKDEFLATLAHELRNPLAPIRNGLTVLRMTRSPDDVTRVVGMMDRQLGHLVNLVDDLLDVSRVRTGKITLRAERVTIRDAVDAAVEACRPTVDDKRHRLDVALGADELVVTGDMTRLVQIVANLLTNAAKYSEPGGRIVVSAAREGDDAVVRVSDSGMGISPELLPTLWDMFTQVRDTIDKAQGGLGIGLSLVKKLVEMHGGTVTAASPGVGRGSTFTVRLPLAAAAPAADDASPPTTVPAAPRPIARRVLVVDDNEDGAETLAMFLQIAGHETTTAHTGPQALEVARVFAPDVVFLDIGLPAGMDGYEVAQRLRADPHLARTILVALTGWGAEEDKQRSREAGFDYHLTKPVDAAAVRAVLASPAAGGGASPA